MYETRRIKKVVPCCKPPRNFHNYHYGVITQTARTLKCIGWRGCRPGSCQCGPSARKRTLPRMGLMGLFRYCRRTESLLGKIRHFKTFSKNDELFVLPKHHLQRGFCCQRPYRRSQWPRGLRRKSAAARLLRLWVRIRPGAWMSVCCECWVVKERSLRRADHSSRGVLPTVVRRV